MMNHAALHALARKSAMPWIFIILAIVSVTFGVLQPSKAMAQNSADPAQSSTSGGQQLQTALSQASGARPIDLKAEDRAILQQFGAFIQHAKYGEVWAPSATPENWHPFMACNWINTRQFGWYYDDKTPWGNIVHHYGRWAHDQQSGWIWIPGMEFSPGWVVWRTSSQWIGWAPTPPDQDVETIQSDAFNNGGFWTFMETPHFNSGCKGGVAPQAQIPVLLKKTQYVTNFEFRSGIGVIVLPRYIIGPFIDIFINVQPWPDLFYQHMMLVWTFIWNQLDVVSIEITIPCNKAPPSSPQPQPAPPPPSVPPPTTGCNGSVNPDGVCEPNGPDAPRPLRPPTTQPPAPPPQQQPCASPLYRDVSGNCVIPCPSGAHRQSDGTCAPDISLPPPRLCAPPTIMDAYGHCVIACPPGTHPDYRLRSRHRGHGGYNMCAPDRNPTECKPPLETDGRGGCREPQAPCYSPKHRNEQGACVCPQGMQESASGSCFNGPTSCKSPLIPDGNGGCISPPVAPPSESVCPDGKPKMHGTCAQDPEPCTPPGYKDYKGACVTPPSGTPPETTEPGAEPCPEGRHREGRSCVTDPSLPKSCTAPLIPNGKGGCMIPPVVIPPSGSQTGPNGTGKPPVNVPVFCPKGTHLVGRQCITDTVPPIVPPLTKPDPIPPANTLPAPTEKPGGYPGNGGLRRCPDGSYVPHGRMCQSRRPIKDLKTAPGVTYPKWPRPAEKPGQSAPGLGSRTKVCPNGSVVSVYSRCPSSIRTPVPMPDSSVNRNPGNKPRPANPDGGVRKNYQPPIKWPAQKLPIAPRQNYQNINNKLTSPSSQNGGAGSRTGNWGMRNLMRTRSPSADPFD